MARGGITKHDVFEARQALLSKGQNPSIDAIRMELGNTGSKTTIHRYLKEIEETEGTRLDDETLLSSTLKEMVTTLAARLRQEAQALVEAAQNEKAQSEKEWNAERLTLETKLKALEVNASELRERLAHSETERSSLAQSYQASQQSLQVLQQEARDLNALVAEKDKHLTSLEEKHQHAREALEHYRQSVKDQRDQDLSRHEQQVQQLQVEIRTLNQTLSVKQTDITQLNKDNARWITEFNATKRRLADTQNEYSALEIENKEAQRLIGQLRAEIEASSRATATLTDEVKSLQTQLSDANQARHTLDMECNSLQTELALKNEILNKLYQGNSGQTAQSTPEVSG